MLNRSHRFHGYHALDPVYRQGKVVRGGQLSLRHMVNPRRRTYRVAVVVSKKVSKSAVLRNRIRRRVYEAFRAQAGTVTEPYDLVFGCFGEELAAMEQARLLQLVTDLLRKAGATENGKQVAESRNGADNKPVNSAKTGPQSNN